MQPFEYTRATAIQEVIQLLDQDGDDSVYPLAGGTDLLTLMKADIVAPRQLLDLKRVDQLPAGITETPDGITLGALTTLAEIEQSPLIQERCPPLAQAAAVAATPQLRNMATLGGNLLQRPRCWYYRSPLFHCWLKGGDECHAYDGENQLHALFGGGPCYAVHPSDLAPALLALDAEVHFVGAQGERTVPLADLFALPEDHRRRETVLAFDELIHSVRIPATALGNKGHFLKAMDRKVWAFALVSVATVLHLDGGRISDARIILGGVAPIPWRVPAAEQRLVGSQLDAERIVQAAEAALAGAEPLRHNAYKLPLAQSLVRRALTLLADSAESNA
ncbi:MAG: molybdopterin dehydrogenase [Chloroflexi bacterium]|nr:MAG: molybdopterin dehydrogenase [Chloroflexota bacterium]